MEKEATLSAATTEEILPAKSRERKHSNNSNTDTVQADQVKNGHSTHEVGHKYLINFTI